MTSFAQGETTRSGRTWAAILAVLIVFGQALIGTVQAQRESPRFQLKGLQFEGNTVFSDDTLNRMASEFIGQTVSFDQLEQLAARITAQYRNKGYLFAEALIPVPKRAPDVEEGVITVRILEGKLGKIIINRTADAPISEEQIRDILSPLQPGELLRQATVERALLLLSDTPGISVQSAFEAGEETGLTNLSVDVEGAGRLNGQIDADNYGVPSSGEYRLGAGLRWNAPLRRGDELDLKILQAIDNLTYARAGYNAPISGRGARIDAHYNHLHYGVGAAFFALQSSGSAETYGASLSYPLIRSRGE